MSEVLLQNISKAYRRDIPVLSGITATIRSGEFVVLVGPSGCGKTTLLRMIAGLETVTDGDIFIGGVRVNDLPPRDRDIAMVFQNYALYPHMSVFDNMAFGLKMRKFPKNEISSRVREAAQMLQLENLLARKPKALSGGQLQRVALGRAIVRRPKLFLFDEPLSNLDAKLRVLMRAEIIKLHKKLGVTMIYVTHDQLEAMSMGDRLIILQNGRVQQAGTPLDVYENPLNRFVAGFLGSPSMNFLHCSIDKRKEGVYLQNPFLRIKASPMMEEVFHRHAGLGPAVTVGIRPEDIFPVGAESAKDEGQRVTLTVDFLEPLGNEVLATCHCGDTEVVVRLSPRTSLLPEMTSEFYLAMERAKLFDPRSGELLA